jgi:hypothetical protein
MNQLQILNLHLLFALAVVKDICNTHAIHSVTSIKNPRNDGVYTQTAAAVSQAFTNILSQLPDIQTSYSSRADVYAKYISSILDGVKSRVKSSQTPPTEAILQANILIIRRELATWASEFNAPDFKLKAMTIDLTNTNRVIGFKTPAFTVLTDIHDDTTLIQPQQVFAAAPRPVPISLPGLQTTTPQGIVQPQIIQQMPMQQQPQMIQQMPMQQPQIIQQMPMQQQPQMIQQMPMQQPQMIQQMPMQQPQMIQQMPMQQPQMNPMQPQPHTTNTHTTTPTIELTQDHVDQATAVARQMFKGIPGANSIINTVAKNASNAINTQAEHTASQEAPAQPQTKAQRRAAARTAQALENVRNAQQTVKEIQDTIPTNDKKDKAENQNTKAKADDERKQKLAEIKESKRLLKEEQEAATKKLKEQQEEENKTKRAELNKKKHEELDAQKEAKEKLKQEHEAEALAKKQKRAEEKELQKAADLKKKEELKQKHDADLAKATDEKEKEKLKKEHEEAEKKMKKEQEKAAKEAKEARAKEKKKLEEEQKAAAKKLKKEQEQAAKEAKAEREKEKKKLEAEQKQARQAAKEAQEKVAKEAKAQRKAQKAVVKATTKSSGGGKKKK